MDDLTNQADPGIDDENREQAAEFVRLALPLMSRHQIPPNPRNFTIWYEYVSGRNKELISSVNEIVSSGAFTTNASEKLYQRYFEKPDAEAMEELQDHLKDLIDHTMENIEDACSKVGDATEKVTLQTTIIKASEAPASVQEALDEVIIESKHMTDTGEHLQQELEKTNKEVAALRDELEHIKHAATTDALTGLYNRGFLDTLMTEAINHAEDTDDPLCMLLLDVDHFKEINDNYGHLIGDKVLRFIGMQLKQLTPDSAICARFGGEKFAVVLPGTGLDDAIQISEKIRTAIEASRLKRKDSGKPLGQITVSSGVAQFRDYEEQFDFLQRADLCVYIAKDVGCNRTIHESSPEIEEHEETA